MEVVTEAAFFHATSPTRCDSLAEQYSDKNIIALGRSINSNSPEQLRKPCIPDQGRENGRLQQLFKDQCGHLWLEVKLKYFLLRKIRGFSALRRRRHSLLKTQTRSCLSSS